MEIAAFFMGDSRDWNVAFASIDDHLTFSSSGKMKALQLY